MMGKKGMMGGVALRWSSRYLDILRNGFMKPVRSCVEGEETADSIPVTLNEARRHDPEILHVAVLGTLFRPILGVRHCVRSVIRTSVKGGTQSVV